MSKQTQHEAMWDQLWYANSSSSCFAARHLFERSKDSALATKTAAQNIQPGQYKADRDFVSDCTREVSKNVDARFKKSPGSLG